MPVWRPLAVAPVPRVPQRPPKPYHGLRCLCQGCPQDHQSLIIVSGAFAKATGDSAKATGDSAVISILLVLNSISIGIFEWLYISCTMLGSRDLIWVPVAACSIG